MKRDDAFLKKLLETFKVEAAEHISAITSGLLELESAPAEGRKAEIVETVFREAHSMKGAARAVNLTDVEILCQHIEHVFAALKRREIEPGPNILDLLHKSVDAVSELVSAIGGGEDRGKKDAVRALTDELDNAAKMKMQLTPAQAPSEGFKSARSAETERSSISSDSGERMRIAKSKLDSVLFQTEGLLTAKQAISHKAAEIAHLARDFDVFKKGWADIRPAIRAARTAAQKKGDRDLNSLLDFVEANGERISHFRDAISSLKQSLKRDERTIFAALDELMEDLKSISMLPFSSLLEIMPKIVRDLSHDQGKEVALTIQGAEIEIDRRILDEVKDPLIHLVRNCIDHGIETPDQRVARKKPRTGHVAISIAHREGKTVEIAVSDDGSGVNKQVVRDSAVGLGVISRNEAEELDEGGVLQLIFRSGVTASPIITDISGRGLGLSIVQEKIEKLGGAVHCESDASTGTVFRMILPLTLMSFRGVLVRLDDRHFIIPSAGVDRTIKIKKDRIRTIESRDTVEIDGQTFPLIPLSVVLALPEKEKAAADASVCAAVIGKNGNRIAFSVDEILHERDVLVKGLGKQLVRVRNIAGAAVLGNGEVVPVLNISDIMKSALNAAVISQIPAKMKPAVKKSVLVVEDSVTSRSLLRNILEAAGYDVQTAVDGIDGYTALKTRRFDLVVSDVDMPRMNGFELTVKIRADKAFSNLPVVLVTALESRDDRERGVDVGANAYIIKSSFDQSNLLEVIKRLI